MPVRAILSAMPEFNPGLIPSRSRLPAILIAAGVLLAGAIAVFYFNPHETADVSVTRVQLYSAHTSTKAVNSNVDKHIMGAAAEAQDDLYVLLTVKVSDKLRLPLFIKDETAVLTAPDHTVTEVSALSKQELANLYTTFPDIQKLASAPLARDTQISPGQSVEGMVLLHFPYAKEDAWTKRESATLTLDLFHQSPQTITIPTH
jgi:hypothetical protein